MLLDAPQISIYGNISVNGSYGAPGFEADKASGGGGGGSGGTIIIRGYEVNLSSARLYAQGGAGGAGGEKSTGQTYGGGGGGGGGGGRIKIFYDNTSLYDNATLSSTTLAGGIGGAGGAGGNTDGQDGTTGNTSFIYENQTTYVSTHPYNTFGYYESRVYDTGNATTCYDNITWYG